MPRPIVLSAILVLLPLSGCLEADPGPAPGTDGDRAPGEPTAFSEPLLIDAVRAGGEPVIAITPKGTIMVSAHPGFTHTQREPSPNLVAPNRGQSFIWRSADGGATFVHVGLAGQEEGPRGSGLGVSDPDFAVDGGGRVFFTDLEGLAAASVSRSDDDGQTFTFGNPVASTYGPIDRQWLAAIGTDVYFTGNYFAAQRVLKSTDGGATWLEVGQANCGGDISADLVLGTLYIGCEDGIDVSEDGGATWEHRGPEGAGSEHRVFAEPAVDTAGVVYAVWSTDADVFLAASPDKGRTWGPPINVTDALPRTEKGTHLWPWTSAGSPGRVAVSWYGTPETVDPDVATGDWFVYSAFVLGADTATPTVEVVKVTPTPFHKGPICQSGTACQASGNDRRLGDFFETAIDLSGRLNLVWSDTEAVPDAISHPMFAKQTAGPRLLLPGDVLRTG
ncbi:MAG: WD40/YVTN/BNR-like repeat-containing protein [Methanobacteriota archaeon]